MKKMSHRLSTDSKYFLTFLLPPTHSSQTLCAVKRVRLSNNVFTINITSGAVIDLLHWCLMDISVKSCHSRPACQLFLRRPGWRLTAKRMKLIFVLHGEWIINTLFFTPWIHGRKKNLYVRIPVRIFLSSAQTPWCCSNVSWHVLSFRTSLNNNLPVKPDEVGALKFLGCEFSHHWLVVVIHSC